jgi:hypothetical protein
MRKVVFMAVVALMALCSCKKTKLTEQIPQLKGAWEWNHTAVGGVVGVIHADAEKSLVLIFEDDNKTSVMFNGELVLSGETYSCRKSGNSEYGDYVISMPKEVRKKVAECLGGSENQVLIDGYVRFSKIYTNDETVYLVITEVESSNDFHCNSAFSPTHTLFE